MSIQGMNGKMLLDIKLIANLIMFLLSALHLY